MFTYFLQGDFDAGYMYKCKFSSATEKAKMLPDIVDEPVLAIPVKESKDVPVATLKFK